MKIKNMMIVYVLVNVALFLCLGTAIYFGVSYIAEVGLENIFNQIWQGSGK